MWSKLQSSQQVCLNMTKRANGPPEPNKQTCAHMSAHRLSNMFVKTWVKQASGPPEPNKQTCPHVSTPPVKHVCKNMTETSQWTTWHSIWHSIWHSVWHSYLTFLSGILIWHSSLAFYLALYLTLYYPISVVLQSNVSNQSIEIPLLSAAQCACHRCVGPSDRGGARDFFVIGILWIDGKYPNLRSYGCLMDCNHSK